MTIKFTLLFFIAAFCFSCTSFPGIEKRHYRDGFYIDKKQKEIKVTAVSCKGFQSELQSIKTEEGLIAALSDSVKSDVPQQISEEKKSIIQQNKITIPETKSSRPNFPIEVPKEPFNKKAKTAVVFYVLAKIVLVAAFVVSLFSLISTVLIVAGIAALFALIAIVFGGVAKKELAAQLPYEKELGEKEANDVVGHALGGIITAAFIILLAIIIEWLKKNL